EAVAADCMLEFACYCLCRHFGDKVGPEFRRWSDVAQVLINGFFKIPTHQKKMVYLCQLLIKIAKGKSPELQFENGKKISPLESALFFWTLLEKEEIKLEKLHEDIHRLIQIQVCAVVIVFKFINKNASCMQKLILLPILVSPLRVKLATIIKNKDPYVPLLQSFSYSLLIRKIKSYIELFMEENETKFLIQEVTKYAESKGLEALQSQFVDVSENDKSNLATKQRFVLRIILLRDVLGLYLEICYVLVSCKCCFLNVDSSLYWIYINCLLGLNNLQNVENHGVSICGRKRQRWTYEEDLELKSGVKRFGVGNWTKILAHGDFNNRTSVMLKDRWRTLCRTY
ncbi:TERF1 factor, partial [Mionectes macconnelli]|nr:TERF1 factor [Mionectes macconnelli]